MSILISATNLRDRDGWVTFQPRFNLLSEELLVHHIAHIDLFGDQLELEELIGEFLLLFHHLWGEGDVREVSPVYHYFKHRCIDLEQRREEGRHFFVVASDTTFRLVVTARSG